MSFLHSSLVSFGVITFFLPAILTFLEETDIISPLLQESQSLVLTTHHDARSGTHLPAKGVKLAGLRINPPLPKKSLKVLHKGFDKIWKDREGPDPQISSAASWSKYHEVADKVANQEDQLWAISELAKQVRDLGPKFTDKVLDTREIKQQVIPPIQNAYVALHSDYLGNRERLWAAGVLACLLSKTKNREKDYSKKLRGIDTLRGEREAFFLKDLPVAKVVEKMWFDPDWNTDNFIHILEALSRASVVASIEREMPKIYQPPFDAFQSIFGTFIQLDVPMHTDQALEFMELISRYISWHIGHSGGEPKPPDQKEKNVIRMLFHMVKYNGEQGQKKFNDLIFRPLGLSKVLQSDILIELEALKLPPHLEKAFRPFKDITKLNLHSVLGALNALIVDHPTQHHWEKLYGLLNLLVAYDNKVYEYVDKALEGSPNLVSEMLKMSKTYRPVEFNPAWASSGVKWKSLQRILQRQAYMAEYSQVLSINDKVPNRKVRLLELLKHILAKISTNQGEFSDSDVQNSIMEYTLLLISLRDERRGVLDFYFPTDRPLPKEISTQAFQDLQRFYKPGEGPEILERDGSQS
ncbi:uncharacterized protein MELLADRAFT_109268 [Melampsora larici-populina 98AG31]|uniref:Uncharacterized protein n=1 Tax=Melampsora larici-populina (strain 98AG31 / pathotype 3-4-7) TaxID=747676 RepID=F4RVX7_MELLP|nr:uncharacterized protein MELLADRAFT_109268 [Melampsora larici-populina 98AG31]EGG03437.1 hypothetical protein MELLADRAFT_109268 [Melampsora larici-populina 98AG31]